MHGKMKTVCVMSLMLIIAFLEMKSVNTVDASPNIVFKPLPGTPQGIIYDSETKTAYVCLWDYGAIAEVNVTKVLLGQEDYYQIYYIRGSQNEHIKPLQLLKVSNKIYIAESGTGDINGGGKIAVFDMLSKTFEELTMEFGYEPRALLYFNGYLWVSARDYLVRVNISSYEMQYFYTSTFVAGALVSYGNDIIYISDTGNYIQAFNTTSLSLDEDKLIYDVNCPCGMVIKDNILYVAEFVKADEPTMGTIAVFNLTSYKLIRRIQTATVEGRGVYMLYMDTLGNLWWTDQNFVGGVGHLGVILSNGTSLVFDAKPFQYFMTQIFSSIWFTAGGSSYIGIIDIPRTHYVQRNIADVKADVVTKKIETKRNSVK